MRISQYFFTLFVFFTLSLSSHAGLKTIEFTATVSYVDDLYNALGNNVHVGDQITGTYTLDTAMIDGDPSPEVASSYTHPPIAPGLGFNFNLPNLDYTPDNNAADLNVFVYDGPGVDHYLMHSGTSNIGLLSNGSRVDHVSLYMDDWTGTTLTTAEFNTDLAVLNAFPDKNLIINGRSATGASFMLEAHISSLTLPGARCEAPTGQNTLSFTATITDVYDSSSNNLGLNVGDPIGGYFALDPSKPDMDPSNEHAHYEYPPGDWSGNVELNIAGTTLTGNPDQHHFNVHVANFPASIGSDNFFVSNWYENMVLPSGAIIQGVDLDFYDPNGTALNTTSLPDAIPSTVSGWMYHNVHINGVHPDGTFFSVVATINSLQANFAPAPSPLTISPASGTFLEQQLFHTAIILESDLPPIRNYTVSLDANGFYKPVTCNIGPVTLDNRQTLLCDTNPYYQLNPGTNTLNVEVELVDGTLLNNTATWERLP